MRLEKGNCFLAFRWIIAIPNSVNAVIAAARHLKFLGPSHPLPSVAEQAFDRRSAAEYYRIVAADYGTVNFDISCFGTSCGGSLGENPCYAAVVNLEPSSLNDR
jgi:hypothetical protein